MKIFRNNNTEIIAVTDDKKFIVTVPEKEILKNISGLINLNRI